MTIESAIAEVYATSMEHPYGIKTAVKYLSEKLVVRLTRRTKYSKRNRRNEYVLTVGQPNYLESKAIKRYKKEKLSFPIAQVHVKFNPKKKVKRK